MSTWTFGLTDLEGNALGEVGSAYERSLTLRLNGDPTSTFRIRLDDPLAEVIHSQAVDDSDQWDCLVKVYQDSTLRYVGEIVSVEEGGPVREGEGVSLTVVSAGPLWRLSKRMFRKNASGYFTDGTPAEGLIVDVLDAANLERDTGIRTTGGTITSLYAVPYGTSDAPVRYKPIKELIEEVQAAKIPFPLGSPPSGSLLGSDDFTTDTLGDPLNGRVDDLTNTWATSGDATDLAWTGGTFSRQVTSDSEGRFAFNGAADHVDTGATVDFLFAQSSLSNPIALAAGAFVRATTDRNNYLRAYVTYNAGAGVAGMVVQKRVGGASPVQLTFVPTTDTFPFFSALAWYKVGIAALSSGDWAAWVWDATQPYAPFMTATGYDPDLATGGDLETGKAGFWDNCGTGSGTLDRYYDNFRMADYLGPQSFDFEFAPVEPTIDGTEASTAVTPGANMVHLWTLNIVDRIGTTTDAVFEYGGGNRSAKSYSRSISRDGLLTRAYHLPTDFPVGNVHVGLDADAITQRGLYEEVVPLDINTGELRQAWVDANVAVRKQARQLITFEPSSTAPVFGTDYDLGDTITGRAIVNGTVRFNGEFRVFAVEISLDDEGKETIKPTLTVD